MIIVDTVFWLALANQKDSLHSLAKKQFQKLIKEQFITTWCVVTETCYLLPKRVGIDAPKSLFIKSPQENYRYSTSKLNIANALKN
jgi:predicted nucleic acid-binding protein